MVVPRTRNDYNYNYRMEKKDVEEVFRRNGLLAEYQQQAAVSVWPTVVDETIAYLTVATHVENKTLHVVVDAAAIAHELQAQADTLIRKINQECAQAAIRRLRFAVGEVRPRRSPVVQQVDSEAEARAEEIFQGLDSVALQRAFVRLAMAQQNRDASHLAAGARRCPRCGVMYSGKDSFCPGCRYDAVEGDNESN